MKLTGVTCIAYLRVSSEKQAGEKQTSLGDQQQALEELALRSGTSIGSWYRDEGASGASVEGRAAFLEMLADCQASPRTASHPGLVLVLNDSRWGRFPDPEEATYWRIVLKKIGWIVRFAEGDDVGDGFARGVIRFIGSAQASEYRANVRRNAKRGSRGTATQGFWAARAPYGYRRKVVFPVGRERILGAGQRKATDEKVILTPDAREARVIKQLFERYSRGTESLATVAMWLRDVVPTRNWTRAAVRYTLSSPAYCGDVVSGRAVTDKAERLDGNWHPESEWITHRDAHPAIVTREVFAACQAILFRNGKWTNRVRTDWLLSGIVSCPCGRPFVAGGGGTSKGRPVTQSYRCSTKSGLTVDRCTHRGGIKKEWLEQAVVDAIGGFVSAPAQQRRILKFLDEALAQSQVDHRRSPPELDRQLLEASAVQGRLVSAVADGTLTGAEAKSKLTEIRGRLTRLASERRDVACVPRGGPSVADRRNGLSALLRDFSGAARRLQGPDLRELVLPWIAAARFQAADRVLTLDIRHIPTTALTGLAQTPCLPFARPPAPDLR